MKKIIILCALVTASLFAVTACDTPSQSPSDPASVQQSAVPQEPPTLTLSADLQQGDSTIQIPEFVSPGDNPQIDSLNEQINQNHTKLYEEWKKNPDGVKNLEIKTYSFADENYVQAIVTQLEFPTYGTQGDVFSYNYDIKNHKVITLDEVFPTFDSKFQRSKDDLVDSLISNLVGDSSTASDDQTQASRPLNQNHYSFIGIGPGAKYIPQIQAFRILDNGHVDCYAKVIFLDDDNIEEGYDMLYILHVDPNSENIAIEPYDGKSLIPTTEDPTQSEVSSAV